MDEQKKQVLLQLLENLKTCINTADSFMDILDESENFNAYLADCVEKEEDDNADDAQEAG